MSEEKKEHILQSQLQEYCESGVYPMHMPGHKRSLAPVPGLPYAWDVTEVDGTDDLHHAGGILRDAMDRTARLFGSRQTWYLVNGSTCGILAAIYACAGVGGEVIAARNCHKSVFHAAELLDLKVHWVLPRYLPDWEICGAVSAEDIERLLREHPGVKTVIITSPTYEGVVSDIASIAAVCHAAGARLITDEAHGAHFGLFRSEQAGQDDFVETEGKAQGTSSFETWTGAEDVDRNANETGKAFPDSALHLGADLVVQSAHKTLPSLTQTALLHLGRKAADPLRLERTVSHALDIFETSSPSYPLMASLDGCTGLLENRGKELFAEWARQIRKTEETAAGLERLELMRFQQPRGEGMTDRSKFLLRAAPGINVTGEQLYVFLEKECGIVPEMHCGRNVLLMSGCGDTPEGWERVRTALILLNDRLGGRAEEGKTVTTAPQRPGEEGTAPLRSGEGKTDLPRPEEKAARTVEILKDTSAKGTAGRPAEESMGPDGALMTLKAPEMVVSAADARRAVLRGKTKRVPLAEAEGCVSAEYVMVYPPGIPILIPGERITRQAVRLTAELAEQGANMVQDEIN